MKPVREMIEMTPQELVRLVFDHHPALSGRGPWRADDAILQINDSKCTISWVPVPSPQQQEMK
jgi:hypothetical protein